MARKKNEPTYELYEDVVSASDTEKRNSLKGQRIPSIQPVVLGYGGTFEADKEDTVIFGHPESAGIYNGGYDNADPYLDADPYRMDLNFVSAEDVRRRSKGRNW
jgi:hypothetical protein